MPTELLYDCYVLATTREPIGVLRFLDRFLPKRRATRSEYELPDHAGEPESILGSEADILAYLRDNPAEPYALYWNSLAEGQPRRAMAFFTSDDAVILGLSCDSSEQDARDWLSAAKGFLGSEVGTFWVESPAPKSAETFVRELARVPAGHVRIASEGNGRTTMRCS